MCRERSRCICYEDCEACSGGYATLAASQDETKGPLAFTSSCRDGKFGVSCLKDTGKPLLERISDAWLANYILQALLELYEAVAVAREAASRWGLK